MAFTANNDINILQASDSAVVGAGAGNDTYVLSPSTLSANQEVTISDTQGSNKLQLIGGLTIASSTVASNAVLLTLSNGAKVTVLGADTFSYEVGGNPLTATAGTVQTYAQFATTTLGAASVPTTGTVSGTANVTIPGGSTGTTTGQTISLTTANDTKSLTAGSDTVDGSTVTDSLNTGDLIVDASSTDADILNASVTGTSAAPTLVSIETVNVSGKYGSGGIALTNTTGTKTLNLTSPIAAGTATVTDAANARAQEIVAGTNVSSLSVTAISTGTAGTVKVNGGAATSVTVTGGAAADTFDVTIGNGATLTANVGGGTDAFTVNLSGGSASFVGQTNNEAVTFNASSAAQTIDAGTSALVATNGTVTLAGNQNITLKTTSGNMAGVTVTDTTTGTGVTTTVQLTATSTSSDMTKVAADLIDVKTITNANDAITLNDGANLQISAATTTELNIVSKTDNTGTLNLILAGNGNVKDGGNDFATVKLSATKASTVALALDSATDGTNVQLSGGFDITLAATSAAKSVDASALAAKATVSVGDAVIPSFTGSGNNDTVILDAAVSKKLIIDGGAGTDTLKLAAAIDLTDSTNATADGNSVITGIEKIDLNGNALTVFQKQIFTNGSTFELINGGTAASFTVEMDSVVGSLVADLSGVTATGSASVVITGSTGADQITASKAQDVITGGLGGDKINLLSTDVLADTVVYDAWTAASTGSAETTIVTTVSSSSAAPTTLTGVDVITGAKTGDIFKFGGSSDYTAVTNNNTDAERMYNTVNTSALADNSVSVLKGTYDSGAGSFYTNASGTDSLVVFDANSSAGASQYEAIVLVGHVASGTLSYNSGVLLTLA